MTGLSPLDKLGCFATSQGTPSGAPQAQQAAVPRMPTQSDVAAGQAPFVDLVAWCGSASQPPVVLPAGTLLIPSGTCFAAVQAPEPLQRSQPGLAGATLPDIPKPDVENLKCDDTKVPVEESCEEVGHRTASKSSDGHGQRRGDVDGLPATIFVDLSCLRKKSAQDAPSAQSGRMATSSGHR